MNFPLGSCFCLRFNHTQGILIFFYGKSRTNEKLTLTLYKEYHNWLRKWTEPRNHFNVLIQCVIYYIAVQMSSPWVFLVCASWSTTNQCLNCIETNSIVWASDWLLVLPRSHYFHWRTIKKIGLCVYFLTWCSIFFNISFNVLFPPSFLEG